MTDRTTTVTAPVPNPTPCLTPCHTCGYSIPPTFGSRCPECGNIWDELCEQRQVVRQSIHDEFGLRLKRILIQWGAVLLVFAIGATVAYGAVSSVSFFTAFWGIGFGVGASLGIGVWICKLGSLQQFRLNAHAWNQNLWWLHAPWLSIAPLTIIGSGFALFFRFFDQDIGGAVVPIIAVIELCVWFGFLIAALVIWFSKYTQTREELGIVNSKSVTRLHWAWGMIIWFGSACVGFFGGMLGYFFMMTLLGANPMDF